MSLVAHNQMPSFQRLRDKGLSVLDTKDAHKQNIRELHIGLLNMMPDAALEATERQFFRLVGQSNPIAQFHMHPFTLPELERGDKARAHVDAYYETFEQIRAQGLDALIITGANVTGSELADQPFWTPLIEVVNWAAEHVTSTLCSCLATHAVMEFHYQQKRQPQTNKIWGVYPHRVVEPRHPLVADVNTRFDVPHSRWNAISRAQFDAAGVRVLVEGEDSGVHLAVSEDGLRFVFFQGHPEYDTVSLLKEYKRDLMTCVMEARDVCPPFPHNYMNVHHKALLKEYGGYLAGRFKTGSNTPVFPEELIMDDIDNTWGDTAGAVVGNWMGSVYKATHEEQMKPLMDHLDPANPLGLDW